MFNIDLPYKSDSFFCFSQKQKKNKILFANKVDSSRKAGFKKNFLHCSPLRGLGVGKNYCILRPVLWMQ